MTDTEARVLAVLKLFATHTDRSVSTASRVVFGSGDVPARLRDGSTITVRRVDQGLRYMSENWPEGVPWPRHTPRPHSRRRGGDS